MCFTYISIGIRIGVEQKSIATARIQVLKKPNFGTKIKYQRQQKIESDVNKYAGNQPYQKFSNNKL
jgi:hypothetical protein